MYNEQFITHYPLFIVHCPLSIAFVLLINAILLLSGDQDGVLIVPWPPYRYAIVLGTPPDAGINLRYTFL